MPKFQQVYPPLSYFGEHHYDIKTCMCPTCFCYRYCDGPNEVDKFMGHIQAEFKKTEIKRESVKKRLFWITINPPRIADRDPIEFLERIAALLPRRKWISECYYSIEQRSQDDSSSYTGIHAHLLVVSEYPVKTVKRPAQAHREIYSWFQRLYPELNKPAIDLKTYPIDFFTDKMDYIRGLKDDKEKDPKIEQDKKFRLLYSIEPYYYYNAQGEGEPRSQASQEAAKPSPV